MCRSLFCIMANERFAKKHSHVYSILNRCILLTLFGSMLKNFLEFLVYLLYDLSIIIVLWVVLFQSRGWVNRSGTSFVFSPSCCPNSRLDV
jgi:hypothetical protein